MGPIDDDTLVYRVEFRVVSRFPECQLQGGADY
jgi:hypothetical protein